MSEVRYLSSWEVLRIHDRLIAKYGGKEGILNADSLLSAAVRPKNGMYGVEAYPTLRDKAVAYLYGLTQNHPFFDGNKRTAVGTMLVFLAANSVSVEFDPETLHDVVVEAARGSQSTEELSIWAVIPEEGGGHVEVIDPLIEAVFAKYDGLFRRLANEWEEVKNG